MSTKLRNFPMLTKCVGYISHDNNLVPVVDYLEVDLVANSDFDEDELRKAEQDAAEYDGAAVRSIIDVSAIKDADDIGEDDALEYFCTGEHTVIEFMKAATQAQMLTAFLEEVFEGDLSMVIYR
jgi:hypothetical protein